MFAARRDSELRRQCTLCGPQLDEFDLFLDGKLLRTYGSTGQVRLSALLLKLAQYRIVRASSGVPLAVLVDDVTGELDADNLQLFFNTISGAQQAFFTFADKPGFTLPDLTVIPFD
jgi:DNA replication and repair protein RecF